MSSIAKGVFTTGPTTEGLTMSFTNETFTMLWDGMGFIHSESCSYVCYEPHVGIFTHTSKRKACKSRLSNTYALQKKFSLGSVGWARGSCDNFKGLSVLINGPESG